MALGNNQFNALIDDLKSSHGANLAAVILYGSAVNGDYISASSDYNLLIALKQIRPRDLRAAQAPMREWNRMGHPLPVYFTVSELESAPDVFPIEFSQMSRARQVLYGEDLLANLEISNESLRHQTEYELRSKLIQLRRAYIPASVSTERLLNLMSDSLVNFSTLFRAVLVLHDIEPVTAKRDVVQMLAQQLKIDDTPFEKIFQIRDRKFAETVDEATANRLFSDYLEQIESVVEAVDRLEKPSIISR